MTQITIFRNPDCGTSRNTLGILRHAGLEILPEPRVPTFRKEDGELVQDDGVRRA